MTTFIQPAAKIALKNLKKYLTATSAIVTAVMLSVTAAQADPGQYETPTGFSLQNGTVSAPVLTGTNSEYMTITQGSNRAVINWNTFNVGQDATVHFKQQGAAGANSVTVNRVNNGTINKSEIFGTLKANGRIMILDRNGVLFGSSAKTDVSGIVASTGELDGDNTTKFMNGQKFDLINIDANPNASIVNNATLSIKDSGLLAFVAPYVQNNGIINAKLGRVTLAAGKRVTVDFAGDDLIQLAVGEGLANALVENSETGRINARGGRVVMTANAASSVVDNVINMKGVIKANSFSVNNGKIVLSSIGGGKVEVSGEMDVSRPASESNASRSAGSILIEAKNVVVTAAAKLLANIVNEQVCFIICVGVGRGNGGTVDIVAREDLIFRGKIDTTGGIQSGSTGNALLSAANTVYMDSAHQMNSDLVIRALNSIDFMQDFVMKTGTFALQDVVTINLNGKLKRQGLLFASLMGQDELISSASTVNVLSDNADIMQAIHLSSGGETAYVNVSSGTYLGNLDIYKTLNLRGLGTELAPVNIVGTNFFAPSVVDINAEDVVFDGFNVSGLNLNGVTSNGQTDVTITNNAFTGFLLGSAIKVTGGNNVLIGGNNIQASLNGITLLGHEDAHVFGNSITGVLNDGIHVDGGKNLTLLANVITGAGNNGIYVGGDFNKIRMSLNAVLGAKTGVSLVGVSDVQMFLNAIGGTTEDALFVDGADGMNIFLNAIGLSGGHAMNLNSVYNTNIGLNLVGGSGGDGIRINSGENVFIAGNLVLAAGENGITVLDVTNANVLANVVSGAGNDGIYIDPTTGSAMFNVVTGAGNNGITIAGSPGFNASFNYISGSGSNGIEVLDSDETIVFGNRIKDSANNGILVKRSSEVFLAGNVISGSGANGIKIRGGDYNSAVLNKITDSGKNGISIVRSDNAWIVGNRIKDSGRNGISVRNSDFATLSTNFISGSGANGIKVKGGFANNASLNWIWDSGENGVLFDGSDEAWVTGNHIFGSDENGIHVVDAEGALVWQNRVHGSGNDGIRLAYVTGGKVVENRVHNSGGDGIEVNGGSGNQLSFNRVRGSGENGILVTGNSDIIVVYNKVRRSGIDGIRVYGTRYNESEATDTIRISNNNVKHSGNDGISLYDTDGATVRENTVTFFMDDGVQVAYSDNVNIRKNTIDGSGYSAYYNREGEGEGQGYNPTTGIRIGDNEGKDKVAYIPFFFGDYSGGGNIDVSGNTVSNTGVGLSARAFNNGYINIAGNTFNDNSVGMWIGSGLIDLTGATNTFNGGDVAMRFERAERMSWEYPDYPDYPQEGGEEQFLRVYQGPQMITEYADLALVDDTIGTTVFKGQNSYYVELLNGAFFDPGTPTLIDGTQATYDDVFGGLMTAAQLKAIEGMINDYDDDKTLGQIFAGYTNLDDNQILKKILGNNYKSGKAGIIIRNTPSNFGNAGGNNNGGFFSVQDLANLEPAAGGEDPSPSDLAKLEPAAGGDDGNTVNGKCWSNAVGMGGTVSLDLSDNENSILSDKSGCSGDI